MARRLTIDDAVRRLHQENLQWQLKWDPDSEQCTLAVFDDCKFVGGFLFINGYPDDGEQEMKDLLQYVEDNRAVANHRARLELL